MDIRQLCLFCLSFLSALGVYAQAEQKDSTVQDNKGVLITLTDGIATTVRHTGRKIRKVGKEFNAVDTTYICLLYTSGFHAGIQQLVRILSVRQ